jgi:hypothetical protein
VHRTRYQQPRMTFLTKTTVKGDDATSDEGTDEAMDLLSSHNSTACRDEELLNATTSEDDVHSFSSALSSETDDVHSFSSELSYDTTIDDTSIKSQFSRRKRRKKSSTIEESIVQPLGLPGIPLPTLKRRIKPVCLFINYLGSRLPHKQNTQSQPVERVRTSKRLFHHLQTDCISTEQEVILATYRRVDTSTIIPSNEGPSENRKTVRPNCRPRYILRI